MLLLSLVALDKAFIYYFIGYPDSGAGIHEYNANSNIRKPWLRTRDPQTWAAQKTMVGPLGHRAHTQHSSEVVCIVCQWFTPHIIYKSYSTHLCPATLCGNAIIRKSPQVLCDLRWSSLRVPSSKPGFASVKVSIIFISKYIKEEYVYVIM